MAYYIVYVELGMGAGCSNDTSFTRVFNRASAAIAYYKEQKKGHFITNKSVDAIVLATAEFRNGMLCPIKSHTAKTFCTTEFEDEIERNQRNG